jgi:ubiquinone/menaquinone biosynthesis C-methylase UbiE
MQTADTVFAGSIPVLYDRYLGPALFEPYAADLAKRLRLLSAGHVLESAAGTGRVTRALCRALPPEVAVTATDLNQAMLDYAAAQPGAERVVWRQADATALPFEDASFDAVVCQFGLMFFPDNAAGYREACRVLKPGSRFVFSVWDRIEDNEFAKVTTEVLAALFPADPPMFLARTPHGHYQTESMADGLRAAGFRQVAVEAVAQTSRLGSARDLAVGFCQGTPLRNEIEARRAGALQEITEAAASEIAARLGHGPIAGKMRAYVITAER